MEGGDGAVLGWGGGGGLEETTHEAGLGLRGQTMLWRRACRLHCWRAPDVRVTPWAPCLIHAAPANSTAPVAQYRRDGSGCFHNKMSVQEARSLAAGTPLVRPTTDAGVKGVIGSGGVLATLAPTLVLRALMAAGGPVEKVAGLNSKEWALFIALSCNCSA